MSTGTAPRCATLTHGDREATHEITWSTPGSRDEPVTEPVCAECAGSYARRPALKAVIRETASPAPAPEPRPASPGNTCLPARAPADRRN
jgi:hypothetical protein